MWPILIPDKVKIVNELMKCNRVIWADEVEIIQDAYEQLARYVPIDYTK